MGGRQQEVRLCAEGTSLLGVRQCYRLLGSAGPAAAAAEAAEPQADAQQQQQQRPEQQQGGWGLGVRLEALLRLLGGVSFQQAVVFCKYRDGEPAGRLELAFLAGCCSAACCGGMDQRRCTLAGPPLAGPPPDVLPSLAPLADAEVVAERLAAAGYPAACLTAQRSQLERIEALNALRDYR